MTLFEKNQATELPQRKVLDKIGALKDYENSQLNLALLWSDIKIKCLHICREVNLKYLKLLDCWLERTQRLAQSASNL